MIKTHGKSVVLSCLLMCLSHSAWSAVSTEMALDELEMDEQESIMKFLLHPSRNLFRFMASSKIIIFKTK